MAPPISLSLAPYPELTRMHGHPPAVEAISLSGLVPSLSINADAGLAFFLPSSTANQTACGTQCLAGHTASCKPKVQNDKKFAAEFLVVLESGSGQITHGDKFFPNCDHLIFYKGLNLIHDSSSCS